MLRDLQEKLIYILKPSAVFTSHCAPLQIYCVALCEDQRRTVLPNASLYLPQGGAPRIRERAGATMGVF